MILTREDYVAKYGCEPRHYKARVRTDGDGFELRDCTPDEDARADHTDRQIWKAVILAGQVAFIGAATWLALRLTHGLLG